MKKKRKKEEEEREREKKECILCIKNMSHILLNNNKIKKKYFILHPVVPGVVQPVEVGGVAQSSIARVANPPRGGGGSSINLPPP
jgi:hypothetical protein